MFDIKYRPITFNDVIGHSHIKDIFISRIKDGSFTEKSYIIAGPHGSGKTTLGRIFARAMSCDNPQNGEPCNICDSCVNFFSENQMNFEERDAAGHGTIDWVRAIVDTLGHNLFGTKKIILFDESHRMSKESQDVLLKPIEDRSIICIFCTTELNKMRAAIRSRCETFELDRITNKDIITRLEHICVQESLTYDKTAINWITDQCGGHVRDAINSLEQVSKVGDITTDNVKEYLGIGWSTEILGLIENILADDMKNTMSILDMLLYKLSPQDIYESILNNLVNLMYLVNSLEVPSSFDQVKAKDIVTGYSVMNIRDLVSKFNKSSKYITRYNLICEVTLLLDKVHGRFSDTPIMTVKKDVVITNTSPKKDVESLTPIDHLGMNPNSVTRKSMSTVESNIHRRKLSVSQNSNMSSDDFAKKFSEEWE